MQHPTVRIFADHRGPFHVHVHHGIVQSTTRQNPAHEWAQARTLRWERDR